MQLISQSSSPKVFPVSKNAPTHERRRVDYSTYGDPAIESENFSCQRYHHRIFVYGMMRNRLAWVPYTLTGFRARADSGGGNRSAAINKGLSNSLHIRVRRRTRTRDMIDRIGGAINTRAFDDAVHDDDDARLSASVCARARARRETRLFKVSRFVGITGFTSRGNQAGISASDLTLDVSAARKSPAIMSASRRIRRPGGMKI